MRSKIDDRFSLENQKINIFIGSSSESKEIAYAVKNFFEKDKFNVTVWDTAFKRNVSFLSNLKKFTAIFDYAIFVFVKEKENTLIHRGKEYENIPPNTIFEAGLFIGRLGENRTFLIAENTISTFIDNVFSDLKGINLGKTFKNDYNKSHAENVKESTLIIKSEIIENYYSQAEIRFLPSTGLAIGYYENFIIRIMKELKSRSQKTNSKLVLKYGRDNPINYEFDFHKREFSLKIILPDSLRESGHGNAKDTSLDANLDNTFIQTESRPFGIYWKVQTQEEIDRVGFVFYDFPTTLLSSHEAIEMVLSQSVLSKEHSNTEDLVGEKEIHNFVNTIELKAKYSKQTYVKNRIEFVPKFEIIK